jgi:hypothetical protein
VWVDDEFPKDTKAQWNEDTPETQWITEKDGPVFSGSRALKRTATAIAQDFFEGLKSPFVMPAKGKIFTYAYLDPDHPPKTIMLQFNTGGKWTHRAVWGDIDAIDFGEKDTMSRKSIGPLPKTGEWTRLEFDASKLSLKAGTKIEGLAFTLYGGTVYWDKTGVQWDSDPANDPLLSLAVWEKENWGKAPKDYPKEITDILKKEKKDEITPGQERKLREYYLENICNTTRPAFETLRQKLNPVQEKRAELDKSIIATLIMKDLDKPRDSFIMVRGQYNRPGEPVRPNVPGFLPELPAGETTNRLALAKWLTDRKHPLTARVAINRFWQQFFGTGIVKTAADFGSQGEPPSHPELLDWMATEFMDSGWDVKKMVKLMVTSATYRQDSKVLPKHLQLDPYNRLLAHGPRFRLDGEELRDNALFVSGLLNPAIGGKPVRPYQPENIWEPVAYTGSNTKTYKQDSGDSLYRRSLYTFWKRTAPPPSMTTFDAPSREQFCVRRERSNTPLQALVLMNDIQHFEAARAFAQRMMTEGGATAEDRLVYGFRTLTSRLPTPGEKSVIQKAYQQQLARFLADKEDAKKVIHNGESKPTAGIDESELAAYTLVASMMLNLDETVTRN